MKVFCSFATLVRITCWIAGGCLVAGIALGHAHEEPTTTPASGAPDAGVALTQR